jgi:hypothetical protein
MKKFLDDIQERIDKISWIIQKIKSDEIKLVNKDNVLDHLTYLLFILENAINGDEWASNWIMNEKKLIKS